VKVEEMEPGMEALLERLVPDLAIQWKGATEEQIDKIQKIVRQISGNDLPKFYHWFLLRMGQSMGQLSIPEMDYSAATILDWYGDDFEDDGSKFFMIGKTSEEMLELHMYYDFNYPARDDARLTRRAEDGGEDFRAYDTFREMIASTVVRRSAMRSTHFCYGTVSSETGNILPEIEPVIASLGFTKPDVPTGIRCGLFEGKDAIMSVTTAPGLVSNVCGVVLGCGDLKRLRNILGTITTEADFHLEIENDPRRLDFLS